MSFKNKLAQRREWKKGVKHCTFDPMGPGVVRIHLIPPKFSLFGNPSHIVILNGYYLLPLGYSWAVMLSHFMDEVNAFDGKEIAPADEEQIFIQTIAKTKKVYPSADKAVLEDDLQEMLNVLFAVARGEKTEAMIETLSLQAYAKHMSAPHRMDLMISAMADDKGNRRCNQNCLFCYAEKEPMGARPELSTQEWKRILDILRESHVPMVTFTGGEPTLREDLPKLVEYAKWFVTRVNTNGVLLSGSLCEKLKEASLDSLQITLYSHDEDIHNRLVGSTHFADTVQGIRNALAAGLDVSVNTPLCHANQDYENTLSFLKELGVRFVTLSGLILTGSAVETRERQLTEEDLFAIVEKAKAFCDAHGMEMDFTSPGLIEREKLEALGLHVPICGACLSNMAIAPDGTVIPCQSWLKADSGLGNLLTEDWKTVWNRPVCKKLRGMTEKEAEVCPFRKEARHG
ncbi:MAG: radical SAM protein [Clostridia bacterium]|nr:radical SAM protein [Clostridia bacterium]